jgi:hypothetical protein
MAKFSGAAPAAPKAPIKTRSKKAPDTLTHEGGAGWTRKPKSELFLLAVTNMVSENTFYEKADARDDRFEHLIFTVAQSDPDWLARFVPYLRNTMNMRSASIVLAAETVRANLINGKSGEIPNRQIIASAIQRADEPAEMLGYWRNRHGRKIPQPVKRGVADAVARLYNERSFIKYGAGDGYRMADVLDIVHPEPKADWQSALFRAMLDERHGHINPLEVAATLKVVSANRIAMAWSQADFREAFSPEFVDNAGLTWEQASSRYGKLDAKFWAAMAPNMGIFALVRNLRNMDEAEVDNDTAEIVMRKLTDAEVIAKSRMFPLRFYGAFRELNSLRWAQGLETAIGHSLVNVPALSGKTLILVDCSGSMDDTMSAKSKLSRRETASMFGAALALRAEHPTLLAFASDGREVHVPKGGAVLKLAQQTANANRGGTQTMDVLAKAYNGHDRVIILTDEQAFAPDGSTFTGYSGGWAYGARKVPEMVAAIKCPIYTFNLAGYKEAHLPSGSSNRYTFGGLTDAGFTAIELLERGQDADWPF